VVKLAEYDSALSAVYGDPRDCWAYLDLSQAWPQDKGSKLNSLTELADWVAQHIANAQEA
jgi:CRISPR system Cascade subunit CasC